jgi:hypothetical protein
MGREEFGQLAERSRKGLRYTRGFVATRLVMASGGDYFDTTSIRNIEEGKREITDELYEWLIGILGLDRDEAHAALWGLPEGITLEDIRELRRTASERRAARQKAATRAATPEGAAASAPGASSDLGKASELYLTISPATAEPEAA